MSIVTSPPVPTPGPAQDRSAIPPLENGDRLDQKTFHERYKATPEQFKAELIEGMVYVMASPLNPRHGRPHGKLIGWLSLYEEATPGTETLINTTDILGPESEPQPDAALLVLPKYGGQAREDADGYLEGAPEFVGEIASSSESIDLHGKRRDYERHGVKEYLVAAVRQRRVYWWVSRAGRFEPLAPGADGILRSEVFPGLWLDPEALLRHDLARLLSVLRQGLASPEHVAFVARLQSTQRTG